MQYGLTKDEKELIKKNKERELAEMAEARQRDLDLYNSPEFNKLPGIKQLIQQLKMPNKIETVEEEDFVIRSFLRHGSANKIIKELKLKHPDMTFSDTDIREFLVDYKEAIEKQIEVKKKSALRRMMNTKEGLTHELMELAVLAKNLATKYDDADDHTAAISAIKAASDIFYRNAKIEGILDEGTTININTQLDKMVQNVASESSSFKDAIMNVVEKSKQEDFIEATFEEVTDAKDGKK